MRKIEFRPWWKAGLAGFLAIGLLAAPAGAAAPDARTFVADLGTQALQVLGPTVPPAQRAARFRELFESDFDLPGIARFVLGPYAHRLSPPQQQEFMRVFRESLVQAYTERLSLYAGEPFRVTGDRPVDNSDAVIMSQVARRDGKKLEIDWHVINRDGRFLITDVDVDGVSMKASQRSAFAGIIQRNGGSPDALVAVLRQQGAEQR
jgi:phospholipid transport system substrate-binding protein